jgi:hypothetical protein
MNNIDNNLTNDDPHINELQQYTTEDYKRRLRSLTQRILLIHTSVIYNNNEQSGYFDEISGLDFKLLGSTNKIYIVRVWTESYNINCSCSCMDYTMRHRHCKHIYWIGSKKFGNMDSIHWSISTYKNIIAKCWIKEESLKYNVGRNETCPICLDVIDYENDMTVCCKYQCNNAVHVICWCRFYNASGKTNCVICREDTMPIISDY